MDTPEDLDFLKNLEETDPEFVREYLGGKKPDMSATMGDNSITIRQCAESIGVCENTILNHIRSGKLKAKLFDGRWLIKESDFDSYKKSMSIVKGKDNRSIIKFGDSKKKARKPQPVFKEENMNGEALYQKATSRTVTDFLHTWHRNKSTGFSLTTICRDFNQVSKTAVTERQMSGLLSSLKKKGIVIRKGKGIYQVSPTIVGEESNNQPKAQQEVAVSAPSGTMVVDADIETPKVYHKKIERMAIEAFIKNHANPEKDFVFLISDIAREYPHLDRTKLGKACVNMCHNRKLVKGESMGEYISPAKIKASSTAVRSSIGDGGVLEKINKIMNSDFDDGLKAEIIKKLMQD